MSFEMTALLVTWAALVLLALVVAGLVRQVHGLTQGPRPQELGPRPGVLAPDLAALAPAAVGPTLLLFLSDECGACPDILREAVVLAGRTPIRAVFAGAPLDVDAPDGLRIFAERADLFDAYQVPATPFAVLTGADGRIQLAEPVGSVRALHTLMEVAGGRPPSDAVETGPGASSDEVDPELGGSTDEVEPGLGGSSDDGRDEAASAGRHELKGSAR